jgi:hypothetical protein
MNGNDRRDEGAELNALRARMTAIVLGCMIVESPGSEDGTTTVELYEGDSCASTMLR